MENRTDARSVRPVTGGRHQSGKAMPKCPLRPGDPCSLCVPGATGPQDCPTVRLVMDDPELRAMLQEKLAASRARQA
ncbi:DUF6767 domain-containing protein [Devriesea agamarum]|uniref:DUF6767 domain-containing protein n=1 Tax=Devriesea agamarum TaxID=472569 RepID=UPI00071E1B8B|nr:DUF6767 domain-containing protein [Devriesea agamarum]